MKKKTKSFGKDEKEILDLIAKTEKQYVQYLKLTSITDIVEHIESKNYPIHDWDTPLDLNLHLGEKHHAFLE